MTALETAVDNALRRPSLSEEEIYAREVADFARGRRAGIASIPAEQNASVDYNDGYESGVYRRKQLARLAKLAAKNA